MSFNTVAFAGPSAIGKTYIADLLMAKFPNKFEQAKLFTTRHPRANEIPTDRIFVTNEEFDQMIKNGTLLIHDEFGGNRYGFDKKSLYPTNKHLLVNIWPWLSEEMSKLPQVIIIGMQAPNEWEELLVSRMSSRGDNAKTISIRKKLIDRDNFDLNKNKNIIKKHGAYFQIKDDGTIETKILPWISQRLEL